MLIDNEFKMAYYRWRNSDTEGMSYCDLSTKQFIDRVLCSNLIGYHNKIMGMVGLQHLEEYEYNSSSVHGLRTHY
jgi:hypothetical protein